MRPVDKSIFKDNQSRYTPYGDAKPDLLKALGSFCSYCERKGFSSALDVEHIEDKKNNSQKENDWSNFLLACKNCNSIKGTKEVDFNKIFFPHIDNTFRILDYLESGLIVVANNISNGDKIKTKKLIDLIGLDRIPGHSDYSTKDERWEERKKCWEIATRYLKKFESNKTDCKTIIDLAKAYGFWSIWMSVFNRHSLVTQKLLNDFKGTRLSCFQ